MMMFKGLLVQNLYGLSDAQLEYQIEDRCSFQQFLGLARQQRVADTKTCWAFKHRLAALGLMASLFEQLSLNQAAYITRKGQIVASSIIPALLPRNRWEDNARIKAGAVPVRWTKKHSRSHFAYKNHIQIDHDNKLIRDYQVTDASVHDAQVFADLPDDSNTSKDVWADSAYRSEEKVAFLKAQGKRTRSKVRSRVAPMFGAQRNLRRKAFPCIGITRTSMHIGLMNLRYNMRRLCFLKRVSAS